MLYSKIINDLWDTRRDLISDGYDSAIDYLQSLLPDSTIHSFHTGYRTNHWTVPPKWVLKQAYIQDNLTQEKIIDISKHGLHVMSYSQAVDIPHATWDFVNKHLSDNAKCPNGIPFKFSYYKDEWGFCCSTKDRRKFSREKYDADFSIKIDSEFLPGELKVLEYVVRGSRDKEILIMAHLDHPYQINDGLSGVAALIDIALSIKNPKYTYRFWILPETIGSICMLHRFPLPNIDSAIFLDMLGADGLLVCQLPSPVMSPLLGSIKKYTMTTKNLRYIGNDDRVLNFAGIPCYSFNRINHLDNAFGDPYKEYHTSEDNVYGTKNMDDAISTISNILNYYECDETVRCFTNEMPCLSAINSLSTQANMYNFMSDIFSSSEKEQILSICRDDYMEIRDLCELFTKDYSDMLLLLQEFANNGLVVIRNV
jgi:aminopeptidase-like protein